MTDDEFSNAWKTKSLGVYEIPVEFYAWIYSINGKF